MSADNNNVANTLREDTVDRRISNSRFLADATTRHSVYVQRFAKGQAREVLPFVAKARDEAVRRLKKEDLTSITRAGLKRLERDLRNLVNDVYALMGVQVKNNMQEFGEYEADFNNRLLNKVSTEKMQDAPSESVQREVFNTSMSVKYDREGNGLKVGTALDRFSSKKASQIVQVVRDNVNQGNDTETAIEDVNHVSRTLAALTAAALVRTIVTHTSVAGKAASVKANKKLLEEELFIAVLDSGTTEICRPLDGERFPVGEGPQPPLHYGCRSSRVAVPKREFER